MGGKWFVCFPPYLYRGFVVCSWVPSELTFSPKSLDCVPFISLFYVIRVALACSRTEQDERAFPRTSVSLRVNRSSPWSAVPADDADFSPIGNSPEPLVTARRQRANASIYIASEKSRVRCSKTRLGFVGSLFFFFERVTEEFSR